MRHNPGHGILTKFVKYRSAPIDGFKIALNRGRLHVVENRRIESLAAANTNIRASRRDHGPLQSVACPAPRSHSLLLGKAPPRKDGCWPNEMSAFMPAARRSSTITPKIRGATECFVHMTLPGETEAVPAGRFAMNVSRQGVTTGRFVYGRSHLSRPNAVEIDPVELKLSSRTYESVLM